VPQKLRDSLQKLLPIIGWVCDNCRISARHNLHKLQSAVSNLTQEVAHLQMQINNLTPSIATSDGNLKSTDVEPKNLGNTNVQLMVHKTLEDLQLRKSNIVVTGLPETGDAESDRNQFADFCSEHLSTKPCITGCFRLGREMNDRPRRLLVKLRTEQSVVELLRDARKLQTSPEILAKNVFLNPDLSPQQMQLAFEARCRKREKRSATNQGMPATTPGTGATTMTNITTNYPSMSDQLPTATTTIATGADQDLLFNPSSNPSSPSAVTSQSCDQLEHTTSSNRFLQ